jgi:protein-L-isoaspartate(D-aspartate) O-methyltransferase
MRTTVLRSELVEQLAFRGISDPRVLDAFAAVPREAFVPPALADRAYDDAPQPIGHGQTISQPYVVALTVDALGLRAHDRVLEVGAGSGYAAAILGRLVERVDTIERLPELAHSAALVLASLGMTNVHVHTGDGSLGLPARAPFDAIAVAAGAPVPPPSLLAQLEIGGRLVVPSGTLADQRLLRITRTAQDRYERVDLGDVRFVPLVGEEGWRS